MFEVGRVCMKTAGREAGKYCVVLKKMEDGFFLVTGPKSLTGVKRRKCNIVHLEPLVEKLKIKADATDAEVLEAYKEAKLLEKLGLKEVSAEVKAEHKTEKRTEKEEEKHEHKPAEKKEEHKVEHKAEKKEERKPEKKTKPKKAKDDKVSK